MIRKLTTSALVALALTTGGALAAGDGGHIHDEAFSFEGPFGTYDQNQLQRGLKIYTEICSSCHGLQYVPLRSLADEGGVGFTEDQVRAYAAENFEVWDPDLADGDGDYRPAKPVDHFPKGADPLAPDLSLMAKARAGFHGPAGTGLNQLFRGMGGAEYISAFLQGFTGEEKEVAGSVLYENTAFPGGWTAMAPQLYGEDVDFDDGHANDVHHEAMDISAFLMWAAEPKMMERQHAGFVAVLLLVILTSLLYLTNKKLWAPHKGKK
ncbi:cytochrome c1 [Aliiroseovarius subalbicans]|uniref:cytochrome c1 n=1 Tax=Aliiroseovarius subalbicans TaxID=2925840 RepID=UPI001F5A07E9|nr:cytochrome c1 [Aliiroseovarius subalbicans]MCI2399985.1 cytochrome c1 [Aliiroseovarius subalbicans]